METGKTKQDTIAMLTTSVHGDLAAYRGPVAQALLDDPDFFAHLVAWNQRKGQVRDSKIALPLYGLAARMPEYKEHFLAALAMQPPRQLVQAYDHTLSVRPYIPLTPLRKIVTRYLKVREMFPKWFEVTALQHRGSVKRLYAITHTAPSLRAQALLFERAPIGGAAAAVRNLANVPTGQEIGGLIAQYKIPYLVARGALGKRMRDPDVLVAVIDRMSPTEIVTNIRGLQKLGAEEHPAVRAALGEGLKRTRKSKVNVLKTTRAVQALTESGDDELVAQLEDVQERQLVRSIEGDWLFLADKSGSMEHAIEMSRQIAALMGRFVKGKIHLMFFDTVPRYFDATGKTLAAIQTATRGVRANGSTSIGCGLIAAFDRKLAFDGIGIISDGGENANPLFVHAYSAAFGKSNVQPPVYFYKLAGDVDRLSGSMKNGNVDFQVFDLTRQKIDYYSLPNLVQTMNLKRYSLTDEIWDTPLFTIQQALRCPKRFLEVGTR